MRAATDTTGQTTETALTISIHAAHAGSDKYGGVKKIRRKLYFNPRCPCGQRPILLWGLILLKVFQSTLPMRAATLAGAHTGIAHNISIHAAHAGSDHQDALVQQKQDISIHAAHAGSDQPAEFIR